MREKSLTFGDFLFTLKALLLCAVPLFRSSSSDLAADYNVSLCGQSSRRHSFNFNIHSNTAAYCNMLGTRYSSRTLHIQPARWIPKNGSTVEAGFPVAYACLSP